jgi:hypothetical protein
MTPRRALPIRRSLNLSRAAATVLDDPSLGLRLGAAYGARDSGLLARTRAPPVLPAGAGGAEVERRACVPPQLGAASNVDLARTQRTRPDCAVEVKQACVRPDATFVHDTNDACLASRCASTVRSSGRGRLLSR